MIVPDIVKDKWKPQPTTLERLKADLQTTRVQLEDDLRTTRVQLEEDLQTTRVQLEEDLQTTRTELEEDLQTTRTELEITKLKLLNTEARLKMVEQTMTSILSKLNV